MPSLCIIIGAVFGFALADIVVLDNAVAGKYGDGAMAIPTGLLILLLLIRALQGKLD